MNLSLKASLASAALVISACASIPAMAADLYGPRSLKDGPYTPPPAASEPAGPCYFRADTGYSWNRDPHTRWGQAGNDAVTNTSLDGNWFGEFGLGCAGYGSLARYGLRGEVMLGYHGERKFYGEPPVTQTTTPDDPMHTSITTYTLMFNAYKDFGTWSGFTPYVGAGAGLAYNIVDDVYFTNNPNLVNTIHGDRDIAFAWSLMAGVGIQLSSRAVLDVGYRYLDFGRATSERHDTAFFVNPRAYFDDLAGHQFKVGLRYNFGSGCCEAAPYQPMK